MDHPTLHVLLDFSLARMVNISSQVIERVVSIARKRGSTRHGGKTALVAPDNIEYGMSRMYQMIAELKKVPYEIQVFRSLEEAKQWLILSQ